MIVFIRLATLDVSARPPGFAPGDRPAKCVEPDEITTRGGSPSLRLRCLVGPIHTLQRGKVRVADDPPGAATIPRRRMRRRHFGRWGDSSWRKVSEALINPVIPEELAALAADSVAEAIKRQHERYWPDGTRRLYLYVT